MQKGRFYNKNFINTVNVTNKVKNLQRIQFQNVKFQRQQMFSVYKRLIQIKYATRLFTLSEKKRLANIQKYSNYTKAFSLVCMLLLELASIFHVTTGRQCFL